MSAVNSWSITTLAPSLSPTILLCVSPKGIKRQTDKGLESKNSGGILFKKETCGRKREETADLPPPTPFLYKKSGALFVRVGSIFQVPLVDKLTRLHTVYVRTHTYR